MAAISPTTTLDARFSSPTAAAVPWSHGREILEEAEVSWLTTVRPDGRPHVTPLLTVWLDDAVHFCSGVTEQKVKNLEHNPRCVITTGNNGLNSGIDVVVEGTAVVESNEAQLQRLADLYASKYPGWHFDVKDGGFQGEGGRALVFRVEPDVAFGFGKGEPYSQTRWRF